MVADTASHDGINTARLPLLVFQHHSGGADDDRDGGDDEMLMYSVSQKSLLHGTIAPELVAGKNMCWTTPQGWMLVKAPSAAAWLWNPRTRDKIVLPDVGEEHADEIPLHCKCLLTYKDAAHPECHIVLFHYLEPTMWYCRVADNSNGGDRRWRRYTYDVGDYEVPGEPVTKRAISSIATVQGELFFVSSSEDMCAITFPSSGGDPEFGYFDVCMVDFPDGMCSGRTWLVEKDDGLFLVFIIFVGLDPNSIGAIHVYEMDFSTETWCRVHDIGDAVLLLEDANMAASCPASPLGLQANQIYFMKNMIEDDADLCVFDLGSGTQEISQVYQHDNLQICRQPFWIIPPAY